LLGHTQDVAVRIVVDARLSGVCLVKAGGTQQLPAFGRGVNAPGESVEPVVLVVEAPNLSPDRGLLTILPAIACISTSLSLPAVVGEKTLTTAKKSPDWG
jgi:hypothetical protein